MRSKIYKSAFLLISSLSLLGCVKTRDIPQGHLVYLACGDSITAGERNAPGNAPGNFAVRALGVPATFIKLGFPGESARDFIQLRREQFVDSLASIPQGHNIVMSLGYGANDLNVSSKERVLTDIVRLVCWARDTAHVAQIVLIPVMNRTDKWGFTREGDGTKSNHFNESRLWLNKELHALKLPGVSVASELDSPQMYADDYPANKALCADEVHPLDAGAEILGTGTIAKGIRRILEK